MTCSKDKTVKLWSVEQKSCVITIEDTSIIWDCSFIHGSPNLVVFGNENGDVKFYDIDKGRVLWDFSPFTDLIDTIFQFKLSSNRYSIFNISQIKTGDGNIIFVGGEDKFIFYNVKTRKIVYETENFRSFVFFLYNDRNKCVISHLSHITEININSKQMKDLCKIDSTATNGICVDKWLLFNDSNNYFNIYNLVNEKIINKVLLDRNIHKITLYKNKIFVVTSL